MVSFLVFVFGLAVGSFLNSVIFRFEQGKSAFVGRSSCPQCSHALAWYDLVPLLSFLLLQGKCRYCKKQISWQYPLVELATGILFVLVFRHLNFEFGLLYLWVIVSLFILIFVYDLKHFIIPDQVVYSGIGVAFLYRVFEIWNFGDWDLFRISNFEFRILAPLFFLAIYLLSRGRWLGFGDVKLAILMGLFLGWPNILVALFFAFFFGALVGLSLIFLKRKTMKSEVPFGPFLVAGTFIALFWGEHIVNWYLSLVLV